MAAGLISETDFNDQIQNLVQTSRRCHDDWRIKKSDDGHSDYLIIKQTKSCQILSHAEELDVQISDITVNEESDPSCHSHPGETFLTYEYHVIYSKSYSVPVLYFNVFKSDGKQISLEDIWKLVPDIYQKELQADKWSILTQQEHPILGRPFYQLHPCHTGMMMKNVQGLQNTSNYTLSWLSSIGPVVGLNIPLHYANVMESSTTSISASAFTKQSMLTLFETFCCILLLIIFF